VGLAAGSGWAVWGAIALLALAAVVLTIPDAGVGGKAFDDLKAGDCLMSTPDGSLPAEVPTLACAQPHDEEVVGVYDLSPTTWPNEDADGSQADVVDACTSYMRDYVPSTATAGSLLWYGPTHDEWASGERRVVCIDQTRVLTTSVRSSAP
jgi:hypothetical protein